MDRQRGQVLPAAVALILMVLAMFLFMVNTGQTITEKMRVTNAADAAAYSAAVVEARALNMDAYLNRAMIANQIAIAQLVSISSWMSYYATGVDNFHMSLLPINAMLLPDNLLQVADLDVVFGGSELLLRRGKMSASTVNNELQAIIGQAITAENVVIQGLSTAQTLIHGELALGVRQQQVAQDVVQSMDPNMKAELVQTSHDFGSFTHSYAKRGGKGDERGRMAAVTSDSRDPFSKERNWTLTGRDIALVRQGAALKKRGGTDLVGYDEWRSVDTLELHGKLSCGILGWCSDMERPIGWGASEVDGAMGDAGRGYHGNSYAENRRTSLRAESNMRRPPMAQYSGIADSRDVADLDPAAKQTSAVTILVSKPHASTHTSGNAAQTRQTGDLALFSGQPAGGELVALGRAEVFFHRIAFRADGQTELPNLYNPYWRVRMVAPTTGDRAYAALRQGGLVLP